VSYTLCPINIPDIFDCNLKTNYQILIIFGSDSAETNVGLGGKLNSHLMASCIRNICAKNSQNLIIGFQVTVGNVGDVF